MLIDEHEIQAFRTERLASAAILSEVERSVQVLYRLGVGVGKSIAADRLLSDPGTYQRFGLVVYAAPAWDILNERSIVNGKVPAPVEWTILRPRPVADCGSYAEQWDRLEKQGCSALAKGTLCRECQADPPGKALCFWPKQFSSLERIQLIFTTEQQLVLNRSLIPFLRGRTQAGRVLVILDEARLLDTSFEISLHREDLEQFQAIVSHLRRPHGLPSRLADHWLTSIQYLLDASSMEVGSASLQLPGALNYLAFKLQAEGVERYGKSFRYLGYDLGLFPWSAKGERWRDPEGVVRFVARPFLNCHLLILSAHLSRAYASHRLGRSSIVSPFEKTRFLHSQTRVLNLRNRIGADAYFKRNHPQILDLFATLIARNLAENRSTLLVSRKKSKELCATYLEKRLLGWGLKIQLVLGDYSTLPELPDPAVVPLVHYGILGVNDFTEYASAYCLNSYYVSTTELNRHVQDAEPQEFRVRLKIVSGPEMMRRVEIEERGTADLDHTVLGNIYLRKLEVDPVVQAAGRVRFLTRPREVVFFQMHDLGPDVGECEDYRTLAALRHGLGLPAARKLDEGLEAGCIRELIARGLTAAEVATQVGISRRTLFRRLQAESAKFPYKVSSRSFGTPLDAGKSSGGPP